MKKSLSFVLALVLVFSFALGAAANPVKDGLPSFIGNRNIYLTVTHLTPGLVRFDCGWHMDQPFGSTLHYVAGLYNLTSRKMEMTYSGSLGTDKQDLELSFQQVLFPADDYQVVFYVYYVYNGISDVFQKALELQ